MGQLSNISGKEAVKAFERAGWQVRGQVGSHVMMTRDGVRANLSVPQHRELAPGTLRKLIRSAGLSVEEFMSLL
jgi:predicted RNA binding protein YcfA (HicA-like mRNA interferase family)